MISLVKKMWGDFLWVAPFFLLTAVSLLFIDYHRSGPLEQTKIIQIKSGQGASKIARNLQKNNVIRSAFLFSAMARITGGASKLQVGEYEFTPQSSIKNTLKKLTSGAVKQYEITIPEGFTSFQIVQKIKQDKILVGDITRKIKEGSLFPSTYFYTRGDSKLDIIKRMSDKMTALLDEVWPKRPDDCPLKTRNEVLALASLIEKETSLDYERARVASVYLNRIRIGLPLQSDPTVIYGIREGKDFDHDLLIDELQQKHPYNTYKFRGLPPGPICCPGKASILSVFEAKRTKEIYFVADGKGGHVFAKNYKDHLANVRAWRKHNKENKANP